LLKDCPRRDHTTVQRVWQLLLAKRALVEVARSSEKH
jgi:hypothetical protein